MDFSKVKSYISHCWRVLLVTKKPDKIEYKTIVKASGLGIAVIGLIGFLLQLFNQILFS
ncbi:MAG: protein translocase SEC61 complex subunit gamma [Nanoarchaeota archaeon]|nr:protein translocase SEC61 complex subunit gamma [Nanoarchaeota archaeon]MBU1854699.1 protein translocase SEC61 complex subunit gamma [Nanoarchaeota archaeon]